MIYRILLVMAGGALGSALRYLVSEAAKRIAGPAFGWGTLAVNLAGCLAIGLVAGWTGRGVMGEQWRLFLAVGVLGGLTTFSTFSLETILLLRGGAAASGIVYAFLNVAGGAALTLLGILLVPRS